MDLYLRNEKDKNIMFEVFDYDIEKFTKTIDSSYSDNTAFYSKNKEIINWKTDFDNFAKAAVDFHHYSKKELYPIVHSLRTGNDVVEKLPSDYYDYRKTIDYNNETLNSFSPYVMYLSQMLNNMGAINYHNHFTEVDLALKTNINKMNIADTLIKNQKVKNTVLNNIAFTYLLEDQNMVNNQTFLETYHKYSTDKSKKNEIIKIGNAIKLLKTGNPLPEVALIDSKGNTISSGTFAKKNTVIFFWTEKLESHLVGAHKKVMGFKAKHPNWEFIAINLNDNHQEWLNALKDFDFKGTTELHSKDFEDLKAKWAITKIHRTIIIDNNGNIQNAFANIFDVNFEDNLK
jgi:peroxiredoxin